MSERTVFLEALDRPDPGERAAYLDEACADAPALRLRVEALLRSHDAAHGFLEPPAMLPQAGAPLKRLDHYELLEEAGRGGMGVVYKAFDTKLRRIVAVKVLAPTLAASEPARQRFIREARAAASVRDGNVVAIHGVGDGPVPYLVMEFVEGTTLEARLEAGAPLPVDEILRLGAQIARGLAAAHARGLIHRDIKPANILLEDGVPRVKIADFGLARTAAESSLTQIGVIAGSPRYMSPEQARGGKVDHRTDLFSLGTVLHVLCTGKPPFQADNALALLQRIGTDAPPSIRAANPAIPEWLSALVEKLHAKAPAQRFQSAAEVAVLLERGLAGDMVPPRRPSSWPLGILAAILALGLLGGVGYLIRSALLRGQREPVGKEAIRIFADSGHALEGVVDFKDIVGVDHKELLEWRAKLEPGFRLSLVTNRRGQGPPKFNAVAVKEERLLPVIFSPGLTLATHQKDWDANFDAGFRLLNNCTSDRLDGKPGQEVARLWVKDGVRRFSWSGTLETVKAKIRGTKDEPQRPAYLESRPAKGDAAWHATTVLQRGVKWEMLTDLASERLAQAVEEQRAKGWRPDVLAPCWDAGRITFALVAVENTDGPDWLFRMDMTKEEYGKESAERRAAGWFPLALASYGHGAEIRYAAIRVRGRIAGP